MARGTGQVVGIICLEMHHADKEQFLVKEPVQESHCGFLIYGDFV